MVRRTVGVLPLTVPATNSSHNSLSLSIGPNPPGSTVHVAYDSGSTIYYNTCFMVRAVSRCIQREWHEQQP